MVGLLLTKWRNTAILGRAYKAKEVTNQVSLQRQKRKHCKTLEQGTAMTNLHSLYYLWKVMLVFIFHWCQTQCCCSSAVHNLQRQKNSSQSNPTSCIIRTICLVASFSIGIGTRLLLPANKEKEKRVYSSLQNQGVIFPSQWHMELPSSGRELEARQQAQLGPHHVLSQLTVPSPVHQHPTILHQDPVLCNASEKHI